ncbi:hemagglutinin [Rhizobium sp. P32RR-XVIII]|uniref:peptidoglycan-binding protein n=1 Tax=Rhizobium sp. P32RR-XVIII TaxID=2726738 RepID=UPI0014575265|nr:peptidoglycan-binding protein [Rhizobium sp. P32RR-XVIII]NLS02239.1 hemagglutinin [Rhizobium sp. P32RR-XVIII]
MNGSRPNTPRHSDRASLDALNRTIEGLEARIEGLMGNGTHEPRQRVVAPERESHTRSYEPRPAYPRAETRPDPLAEIRERQRALNAGRERAIAERPTYRDPAPAARTPAPQVAQAHAPSPDTMTEIAQALVNLRQDLKRDISDGVAREMNALRAELREIKTSAHDRHFADDIREDMGRLAQSIDQLSSRSTGPEATGLRNEFEELRSLMDGLAREESVRHMESRWDGFENQLHALDTASLQEELVSLAYRLDDIKRHLGGMGESPAVRALEDKLLSIATAMEQFGNMIQPYDRAMSEQFAAMDGRLDEISRAIAASGRTAASGDPALMHRLEGRLNALAEQIDMVGRQAESRSQPADGLADRLEMLTRRVEELANTKATARLDERLEQLSFMLERAQKTAPQADLNRTLADISRKIEALESGSVNDALAERLDYLARRIDEMEVQPAPAVIADDSAFRRIEGRLSDIAARLEESTAAPPTDPLALRNLEDQIANLSALMSSPRAGGDSIPLEFDRRMGAIEDYMATSDEYIIEAARQAAEAVVEAYSRNGGIQAAPAADMAALNALAEDLRHLEDLSRSSEERTHKTFQALHETLVQIAERLDDMETRNKPARRMPLAEADFEIDPYALVPAGTEETQKHASLGKMGASPALHAVETASAPVASAHLAPSAETSAIAIEAATKPVPAAVPSKGSLLSALGKRLIPGKKAVQANALERAVIDPAPSIDPVDLMPSDEASNELLEPGSGAPDVKKILERVRASQAAARNNPKPAAENERADYIAAARRAAQAAAMESDPKATLTKAEKKTQKPAGSSAFARFRRPILLAVGAVLLAIMAFPLARTLTSGEQAPPAEVAVLSDAAQNPVAADSSAMPVDDAEGPVAGSPAESTEPETAAPPAADMTQAGASENRQAAPSEHLTDAAPLGGEGASTLTPGAPPQDAAAFAPKNVPTSLDAAPAAPSISVPDAVQPQSLADAARGGDPLALFEIGARYTEGRNGLPADQAQAANWYQLAADRGFAPAQYRLGSMYEKGTGVARDIGKARAFYEQAASQGNASAMHNLAVLYASGALGQQDYAAAASWFTKAADLGITDSQFNLAILFARGNGVTQDLGESYKWFAIAAQGGDKDAAAKRDEVAKAMKSADLEKARATTSAWKPQPLDNKANGIEIPDAWTGNGTKTSTVDMKKAIRNIQAILNNNGFDAGTPDGEMGAKTIAAIKSFQQSIGKDPTGKINDDTVRALLERNTKPTTKA